MKYLVIALRTAEFDTTYIDKHHAYLQKLRDLGKLETTGPFTDKSGGAYIILAGDISEAKEIAYQDPLYQSKSSTFTVYEWDAH